MKHIGDHGPRTAILSVLLMVIVGGFCCRSALARPYDIQMVLWRGETSAEKAFIRAVFADGLAKKVRVWNAKQSRSCLNEIRAKIQKNPPDLLYLFGTTITLDFAGRVAGTYSSESPIRVPMVFDIVADPVGSRIVKPDGLSGRNVTGVSHMVPLAIQAKVISDLGVKRIAALYNPSESNSVVTLKSLKNFLKNYGIALTEVGVTPHKTQPNQWQELAQKLRGMNVDLIYLPSDSMVISHDKDIVPALNQVHLPTFSATENPIAKAGALMGVISHYSAAGLRAASIAERILQQGANPARIPVSTPSHYLFVVNDATMRALKYYPPVPLLQFAEFINGGGHPQASAPVSEKKAAASNGHSSAVKPTRKERSQTVATANCLYSYAVSAPTPN